jgi:hypothetical protein
MDIYNEAIKRWGKDAQIKQAIEELSELITALCHADRENREHPSDVPIQSAITDEIADVEIMMEQVQVIFNITRTDIDIVRRSKLKRLGEFLKGSQQ